MSGRGYWSMIGEGGQYIGELMSWAAGRRQEPAPDPARGARAFRRYRRRGAGVRPYQGCCCGAGARADGFVRRRR